MAPVGTCWNLALLHAFASHDFYHIRNLLAFTYKPKEWLLLVTPIIIIVKSVLYKIVVVEYILLLSTVDPTLNCHFSSFVVLLALRGRAILPKYLDLLTNI